MKKNEKNYYKRIREVRKEQGKTQQEVADAVNLSRAQYIQHEFGKTRIPSDIIVKLSKYLNVSSDYLLELTDKKTKIK